MARKVNAFSPDTLDTIATLYGQARPYPEILGVDPFLAMGGPAEELDTINNLSWLNRSGNKFYDNWTGGFPDWMGSVGDGYSHDRIKRNITESKSVDQTRGVSNRDKLWNPVLVDLGYGNIKLGTAIDLLQRYSASYPDSDPLDLKQYNDHYDDLARDLSVDAPLNATAKFAVLEAAEAIDFFKRRAPRTWAKADQFEMLGLVATYYNRGREMMNRVATEEQRSGEYEPVPGFGGEKAAQNGWALAMATGREPPFSPMGLAAGRRADRASVPGYSSDAGQRRDQLDPWRYEDWKHRGQGDTRSRRASVNPSKGAGRPTEASREVPVRAVSSARLSGLMGAIPIRSETNALDVLDESGLLRSFSPRRIRPADPGRGPRELAPPPAAGKVERRSQAAPPPIPGGLLGPAGVRLAGAAGEPELYGAPGMPDEADPAGMQPWPSMSSRAIRAVGVKGLGELLAGMSNSAAASPGSSFLAPEGQVLPSGFPQMSPAGLAALRQRAAMPGGRQPVPARSHGGPSSARPHWEDPVSALDAYLRDSQSEVPDVLAAGPATPMTELDTYPAGGLFGRRFAGSKRAAVRRHKRRAGA